MRTGDIPFQFNISLVLKALVRRPDALPSAIRLDLPFLSVLVSPSSIDVSLARDLLVRMRDRRVLDAQECCDGCIADALTSLQQIRGILLDLQIQLRDADESALSPLVELMAVGIRQFLTFEQSLRRQAGSLTADERGWDTPNLFRCARTTSRSPQPVPGPDRGSRWRRGAVRRPTGRLSGPLANPRLCRPGTAPIGSVCDRPERRRP